MPELCARSLAATMILSLKIRSSNISLSELGLPTCYGKENNKKLNKIGAVRKPNNSKDFLSFQS